MKNAFYRYQKFGCSVKLHTNKGVILEGLDHRFGQPQQQVGLNPLSTVGFRSSTQPTKCYRVPFFSKERVKPNKMAETMIMAQRCYFRVFET